MSRDQAPALAHRGMRAGGALAGMGNGPDERRVDTGSVSIAATGRHRADPAGAQRGGAIVRDAERDSTVSDSATQRKSGPVGHRRRPYPYYSHTQYAQPTAETNPYPVAQTDPTNTSATTDSPPAADADPIPDAGSDYSSTPSGSDVCEWCGQRWGNGHDLRDHHRPGFSDGPGVPRGSRRSDGVVHDDDLQRPRHVGRPVQRDSQRGWGDASLLRPSPRWLGVGDGQPVRRLGPGWDVGRDDLHRRGVGWRDGEPMQRLRERRGSSVGLLGAGGLT